MERQETHPYYPLDIILAGHVYVPNSWSVLSLISAFAAVLGVVLTLALLTARWANPRLETGEQAVVLWFVLSGSIHICFEGYFVSNHGRMAGMTDVFGQLWKEYALSDSRYLSSDTLVLSMEVLTVTIWGPLCLLTAAFIVWGSPYRHPLQALVSTGHLYGNMIYLLTSLVDEISRDRVYYRPEPYYFWLYFFGMNAIWLVVPGYCLYTSIQASAQAFEFQTTVSTRGEKKRN